MVKEHRSVFTQIIKPGLQVQMCQLQVTNQCCCLSGEFRQKMASRLSDSMMDVLMSLRYVVNFPFYHNVSVICIFGSWVTFVIYFWAYIPAGVNSQYSWKFSAEIAPPHLLLFICDCSGHTYKLGKMPAQVCSKKIVSQVRMEEIEATGFLRLKTGMQQQLERHAEPELLLKRQSREKPRLEPCRGKHHVSLCCQLHTYWCPPAAIPAPVSAPAPYPALPKRTFFPCSAWPAVVQSHTGLLFDFTSVLRWLRQARPGISAMWLKNGKKRQEYKRRHTGCGSGSLAEEWVVD